MSTPTPAPTQSCWTPDTLAQALTDGRYDPTGPGPRPVGHTRPRTVGPRATAPRPAARRR